MGYFEANLTQLDFNRDIIIKYDANWYQKWLFNNKWEYNVNK